MTHTGFLPLPHLDDSVVDEEFIQRALGAVVGSAAGDALGAPFEFGPPGGYARRFPEPVIGGRGEMNGGGPWKPAELTDDTQMAVIQAESLLDRRGLDERDLFARFRTWASDAKDVGVQTRAVLDSDLVGSEAAAQHHRRTGRAAGNGTIMRAAPSAVLLARGAERDSIEFARRTAAVTHGDPATWWGTALVHVIIRAAVRGDNPWVALDRTVGSLPEDQNLYRRILRTDWTPDEGVTSPNGSRLPNGTVWTCLAEAVWAVRHTDTFTGAVTAAVNLGGDTDTVAAVAGGIAGAVHGIAAIPSRWTTYLNGSITEPGGARHLRLDDLRVLTHRLSGMHPAPDPAPGSVLSTRTLHGANLRGGDIASLFAGTDTGNLATGIGPSEVMPGVHAADLRAATTVPTDWAVVSLCRVGGLFEDHPCRREIHLIDRDPDRRGNPNIGLELALTDALESVDAFRSEGREVVVHCHGGASRTGLVLRARLINQRRWTDRQAVAFLSDRWPHLGLWNQSFTRALARMPHTTVADDPSTLNSDSPTTDLPAPRHLR